MYDLSFGIFPVPNAADLETIFEAVYGGDYPYASFLDVQGLKRSIYSDDILMLVAVDPADDAVLGTGSVVFDIGAHSDLIGEFGRLAVHPGARGRGVGGASGGAGRGGRGGVPGDG